MRKHKRNKFKHISNVQRAIVRTLTDVCDMFSENNKELREQIEHLEKMLSIAEKALIRKDEELEIKETSMINATALIELLQEENNKLRKSLAK